MLQAMALNAKLRVKEEGGDVLNMQSLFKVRALDCIISSTNFCTANFTYLLLLSSLQFFQVSAGRQGQRPSG